MLPNEITNDQLTAKDVPPADAHYDTIQEFALTFDGYKQNGSFDACAEIANHRRHDSLSDLRTCLFFEQRRWRHFGNEPDQEAMSYIRSVVEKIRQRIGDGIRG
jgi:hypothetical protein